MSIGNVIRTYRKEKQLTQEQMANHLGVTAPAVNKWENGNSFPDISLLVPIARLLEIHTDTLLCYEETLTDEEINQFVLEINENFKTEPYDTVFSLAMEKIQKYPNCEKLIFSLAPVLDFYRLLLPQEDTTHYHKLIHELYQRLLNSDDLLIVHTALLSLFSSSISRQEYEKAQYYLDRLPKESFNPKRYQALLYDKQDEQTKAYETYEQLLFSGYSDLSWALQGLYRLTMKENDLKRARSLIEKQKSLARLLEMGPYMEASSEWDFVLSQKDKEGALRVLKILLENIDNLDAGRHSDLYRHMKFSKDATKNLTFMLKKTFKEEDCPDFLKEEEGYQQLIKEFHRREII